MGDIIGRGRYARATYPIAAKSSGGWVTALDVAFGSLPAQTLSGSGPFTVAGREWVKSFFFGGAEVSAPQIVPGQGLSVHPDTGASEYLLVNLASILPAAAQKFSTSLRLWTLMGANDFDSSGGDFSQIAGNTQSGSASLAYAGINNWQVRDVVSHGATQSGTAAFLVSGTGSSVALTEIPSLDAFGSRLLLGVTANANFPVDVDATYPDGPFLTLAGSLAPPTLEWPITTTPVFFSDYYVGPGVAAAGAPATGTVIRFRVDYRI